MSRISTWALFGVVPLAAALGFACESQVGTSSSAQGGSGSGTESSSTDGSGSMSTTGTCSSFCSAGDVVSVAIVPQDPVIVVSNGTIPPPTTFTAVGTTGDGSTVPVTGAWSLDRLDVASINPGNGALTATGLLGGVATVTFKYEALTATTTATVKLHITSDPQAIDPTIKATFGTATTADPTMSMLYPYDKTVFPRGLRGPIIQWDGGGANDVYYVHASSPTFEFEGWQTVPPPSRFDFPAMPVDVWKKLTDSTSGDIAIDVQRYDGAQAYLPVERTWKIAPANLAGTIYFWEVNTGDVVRLKPGDTQPEHFIQKPGGHGCVACHSVSKNGSVIVASFDGGYSPWGTFDAATGQSLYDSGISSGFQAVSPTGSHVLWRHWSDGGFNSTGYLSLSTATNATELAQLNPGGGAPSHPSWSGDGTKVAFAVRTDGNGLDFTTSNLWITDVDLANPSFSNTHQIVPNVAGRPTTTYPTFGPDSKWIAFERANQARTRAALSDISLTNLDGSTVIPLDNANGVGVLTGSEISSTYEPTFMPVAAGGYMWLVVVSERRYGNTLTDLNPASRHKQLWVTAIDLAPTAGTDPSHPAFWLPGQELNNNNMRGEWALSPCKQLGDTCTAGYDCCDGFCQDDGMGNFTCSQSGGRCAQLGEACTTAADCCDPKAQCSGGFCSQAVPN